jgi:hypothetical protein
MPTGAFQAEHLRHSIVPRLFRNGVTVRRPVTAFALRSSSSGPPLPVSAARSPHSRLSPATLIRITAHAARMLPSRTAWATAFVLWATSVTGNSPINAAQRGADGSQGGAALGGWRLLHEAVAAAKDLGLVKHALALAGPGRVATDLAVHLQATRFEWVGWASASTTGSRE